MTASTRPAMDMQRLLKVGPELASSPDQVIGPGSPLTSRLSTSNPKEWTRLCGLISAYRLLDVITLMDRTVPRALNSMRRPIRRNEKVLHVRYLTFWPYFSLNFTPGHGHTWGLAEGVA